MSTKMNTTKATIFPCLRYRDAPAAIEWLCATFGFEKQAVYPNDDGTIAHAQLTFGDGMIMVGSVLETIHGDDQLGNQAGRAKTRVTSTLNPCYGLRTSQAIPI